jgi:tetratricopeptide (TPR) repeat protein
MLECQVSDDVVRAVTELLESAERSGDVDDVARAVEILEAVPEPTAAHLTLLGVAQRQRFSRTGDPTMLRRSTAAFRAALAGTRADDPAWSAHASNLGNALTDVFAATGAVEALTEAIALLRAAHAALDDDDPNLPACQTNLGNALVAYDRLVGDPDALAEALVLLRAAWAAALAGSPERASTASNLGIALAHLAVATSDSAVLDESVALQQEAVDATPPGHPDRAVYLSNLGNAATEQFELTGDPASLDRAAAAHRQAVDALPASSPDLARCLSNLARVLVRGHESTGDPRTLAEAVQHLRRAVARTSEVDPARPVRLLNLGSALSSQHSLTGAQSTLEEAVDVLRAAAAAIPERHHDRTTTQSALGEALTRLVELTGNAAMLEEAILVLRQAASAMPSERAAYPQRLSNLASALLRRFEHLRSMNDLDEAIDAARQAAATTRAGHPARPLRLSNLGAALTTRHGFTGDPGDLIESVRVHREAVEQTHPQHPDRPRRQSGLGVALTRQYLADDDVGTLAEAVTVLRGATRDVRRDDPNRAGYLSNYANALRQWFHETGNADALDTAAEALRDAVAAVTVEHPDQAAYQANLAATLRSRFRHSGEPAHAHESVAAYLAAAEVVSAPTMIRATAALNAGRLAAELEAAELADEGFGLAVGLLDRLAWRGLARDDQEELLRRFSGVASDAAAWALERGDPTRAVTLLEQGRGVLIAQAIDARSPSALLRERAPDLAERLDQLHAELETEAPVELAGARHDRRIALARERDRLVDEVRARGLGRLVDPPRLDELQAAAAGGPVIVVNISRYRCDALAVSSTDVHAIPLDITADEVQQHAIALRDGRGTVDAIDDVLSWLRHRVTTPVLDDLKVPARADPEVAQRVWWCPTGLLAFLPLHAAGVHERAVSSYTPTLRALRYARERPAPELPGSSSPKLLVALSAAPHLLALPAANREARLVGRWLPDAKLLSGADATAAAVLSALADAHWVHLACHGEQDVSAPGKARLLMFDEPIAMRDLIGRRLPRAEFAFLSACDTMRGGVELADEAVTLASAMQLAGYRHVIATLWAAHDSVAPRIVDAVYAGLANAGTDPAPSARALHLAISAARRRYSATPRAWAGYVHVGP